MEKFARFAQDSAGNLLTTGTVTVYRAGTVSLASIYNTDSLSDAKINPFSLDATGKVEFFARNDSYDISIVSGANTVTINGVQLLMRLVSGTFAARPAFGSADRLYYATDTRAFYLDTGAAWVGVADAIIGSARTAHGGVVTGTTTIPLDNTIPQNTEGTEFTQLATAYACKHSDSVLEIDVFLPLVASSATGGEPIIALFVDSNVNALAVAKADAVAANNGQPMALKLFYAPGDTTSHTYKLRYGPSAAATITINGENAAQLFGGKALASLSIKEIRP